ncbi:MAG: glyoxalase [Phototrophicales bacterium]|nr:MAG: glyoxalase [Phototrophicales bacterium]
MIMVFSHIALNCKDPIAVEKFYTKHFGFKRTRVIPLSEGNQIVFTKSGSVYLEIFSAQGENPAPAPANDGHAFPGIRHIAFQVENVDAKLAEMGDEAKITLGPLSFDDFIPGWRTVWVSDPEGNIVEISQGYQDEANPPALE